MSPSAPPTRSELKRQAVLDAAAHEFLHQGFDGTTMDAIAKTASVSKRTVYHHFASKEKLFAAIVSELLNRVGELEPVSYDASRALNTQLDEIGLRLARLTTDASFLGLARVVVSRMIQTPEMSLGSLGIEDRGKKIIVDWLRQATRDRRLRVKNYSQAARQYASLIQEFSFWPCLIENLAPPSNRQLKTVVSEATRLFLAAYKVDESDV